MSLPEPLQDLLETLESLPDRSDRIAVLISLSEGFQPVPESVMPKPYPEETRVPGCESEAFIFSEPNPDGTLKFYFAVENPQGVSAMALAAVLDQSCSGTPLNQVLEIPDEVVFDIFGRELSMGKSMGLINMVKTVKALVKRAS